MNNKSLSKFLACEIVVEKMKGYVITLYRCPNQNYGEFEYFLLSLENLLGDIRNQDPAFTILLAEFNTISKSWWVHGITNSEGTRTESLSSLFCFSQLNENQHTSS